MRDLIKKQKIYQVEVMLEGDVFPTEKEKMDYLEEQGFPDRKSYEKALQEAGGPLDERAQGAANGEKEKEKKIKNLLSRKTIRQASMALLHLEQGKKDAYLDEEVKRRLGIEGGDSKNNISLKDRLGRNSGKS